MKNFFGLLIGISLAGSISNATGGILCSGETYKGTKIEISACVPHSIMGICSDLKVSKNGTEILNIPRNQVSGFYSSQNFTGLIAYDDNMDRVLVQLEYVKKGHPKNFLKVTLDNTEFKFTDVTCEFE